MVHLRSLFRRKTEEDYEKSVRESYYKRGISSCLWIVTNRCNLKCRHCYVDAGEPIHDELDLELAEKVIEELSDYEVPLLFISGGEPLLRQDIFEILSHATSVIPRVILSSNGVLIDREEAGKLREIGIARVMVPLYGERKFHDYYTGIKGSHDRLLNSIKCLKDEGIKVGLKTVINRETFSQMPNVFNLASTLELDLIYLCDLIPCGRGEQLLEYRLSVPEWRRLLTWIIDEFLLGDGPEFEIDIGAHPSVSIFVMKELERRGIDVSYARTRLLWKRACPVGQGYIAIAPNGDTLLCNFSPELRIGNIVREGLERIISSAVLKSLSRTDKLGGSCGVCLFKEMCGGCRVKALLHSNDLFGEDPSCLIS